MEKKQIMIRLDADLVKQMKLHCLEKDLKVQNYIEALIKKDLKIK